MITPIRKNGASSPLAALDTERSEQAVCDQTRKGLL